VRRAAIFAGLGLAVVAAGATLYFLNRPDETPPPAMESQAEAPQPAAPAETASTASTASAPSSAVESAESQSESAAPASEAAPAPAEQVAAAETVAEPAPEPETVTAEAAPEQPAPEPETVTAEAAPEQPAPEPETLPAAAAPEQPASAPVAESAAPANAPQTAALPEQPAEPAPAPPQFDIVRVEPDGEAVVAGRAEPGAKVTLFDGETAIGSVVADGNGDWVLIPGKPLPPGSRELSLVAELPDGQQVPSDKVVILAVPEPKVATAQAPATGQTETTEPAAPLAVLATRKGSEPSQVLQQPESASEGLSDRDLVLRAVDYDTDGNVIISGEAAPNATVYLYLDEQPIGRTAADQKGRWVLRPDGPVASGLHRLRVDQIGPEGAVVARIETPFSRAAILTDLPGERFVIVQPGNSLWRIARRSYGEGTRYSVIYQSNADQIRDPDLIYPGQIFLVPTIN